MEKGFKSRQIMTKCTSAKTSVIVVMGLVQCTLLILKPIGLDTSTKTSNKDMAEVLLIADFSMRENIKQVLLKEKL